MEKENKEFESIKHLNKEGIEFWLARELQEVLQYRQWRNFDHVIDTAKIACKISQHEVSDHFVEVSKTVAMPLTSTDKAKKHIGFADVSKTDTKSKKNQGLQPLALRLLSNRYER